MLKSHPRPGATALEAVARCLALVDRRDGQYVLGTGNWNPDTDVPWTTRDGLLGGDCVTVFCHGFKVKRRRPGYNRGPWATISDDINCNSLIEDADHPDENDLTERILRPEIGALLTFPSVYKNGRRISIGHIEIVVGIDRCLEWDVTAPDYSLLDVVAIRGPNGRKPAAVRGTGAAFNRHDKLWPKPAHRTCMLRVRP